MLGWRAEIRANERAGLVCGKPLSRFSGGGWRTDWFSGWGARAGGWPEWWQPLRSGEQGAPVMLGLTAGEGRRRAREGLGVPVELRSS